MGKQRKIPKNLDIEELVFQEECTKTYFGGKRKQFMETIQATTEIDKKIKKEVEKKVENRFKRMDAQRADEIRQENYHKAMKRIQVSEGR